MPKVEISFVTNRNHLPGNRRKVFGSQFNPDGVAALRFGKAVCDVRGNKATISNIEVLDDPHVIRHVDPVPKSGSGKFLHDLQKEMLRQRDTVVFIHGFNVSFPEAVRSAARLASNLARDMNIVLFSWPSDGKSIPFMSYYSDREDARASGPALARAYLKLFEFVRKQREEERMKLLKKHGADAALDRATEVEASELCDRGIHIVAHSMGNYVLRHGIQAIRAKDPRAVVRMFDEVIMAAADEDDDTFEDEAKLRLLPRISRRITVYHNRHDRALVISDRTKANPDRLGAEGPRMLDLLPKKVNIVDCSAVAAQADPVARHTYFVGSEEVSRDIALVLADTPNEALEHREVIRPERAYRLRRRDL